VAAFSFVAEVNKGKLEHMKEKLRIIGKLFLVIICTICLIYLIHKDETVFRLKQPLGEWISSDDVIILVDALTKENGFFEERIRQGDENGYLDYESYLALLEMLGMQDKEELLYEKKYRKEFFVLKEDWYQAYDAMLKACGMEENIICQKVNILCGNEELAAKKIEDKCLLAGDGNIYRYCSKDFEACRFQTVAAYVTGNRLLTVKETSVEEFTLENIWIMEEEDERLQIFFEDFEIIAPWNNQSEKERKNIKRENIADITFGTGRILEVISKQERISGKLLRLSETELEIEGKGTYPIHDSCKVYRLYGELLEQEIGILQLGYDFADYVIEDGKICGVLILRKENMESIRVAIKTDGFASLYHKEITIKADCDTEIIYGSYSQRKTDIIREGEEISLNEDSAYLDGDMVQIKPMILSGKIQVSSLTRSQGIPSFRGNLQITKTKEGLTLVNEVLLEEYLYSVVPSEMPASYPAEALKAQAVCARTYAYRYLEKPGLGGIGANVDDSVGYQVYNNIAENAASTKAVKETAGRLLFHGEEPVNTYYYSTSCGYGTDAGVWKESNVEDYPYLTSVHINNQSLDSMASEMKQEEVVREYLLTVNEQDYESGEAWYRWNYEVKELKVSVLYERLYSRFWADNSKVLKLTGGDAKAKNAVYESIEPSEFEEIHNMECTKRREGGVMDELLLYTDTGTYKVISEYNIRYVLNQGGEVTRQDGSNVSCGQLLPSAYMILDNHVGNDVLTGYRIIGGGYGHGVGMSQNGAKNMAKQGMDSEEIIAFFYAGCEQKQIY